VNSNRTTTPTKTTKKQTVLLVPADAWDTLHQSLVLDTESCAIDPDLRREIAKALDQVRHITSEVTALLDVAEEVPRCARLTTDAGMAHIIGDERIERLKQALRFFRSHFEINGGRRHYRKQLL
jgi:hypothetical protein